MNLTDQEQVVLKAIKSLLRTPTSPALISDVIKAIGYPKATTKKVLARLAEKGIVAVHRHDYPASLAPTERKLMLRLRDGQGNWRYFNAVSMRTRNPKKSKGKVALKRAGRALKGFAQGALSAGSEILGAGAMALNPKKRGDLYNVYLVKGRQKVFLAVVAATSAIKAKEQSKSVVLQKYPQGIPTGWRVKVESTEANPTRRLKVRNKYIDLVIKGQAKKTPQGWKVGKKTFAQGRGTVNVSSGYYLDRATGLVYAKRARNADKKDSDHPIEVTKHWRAGPPGYLTPWQRAHAAGQKQLFETGIKPAKGKGRNASRASRNRKASSSRRTRVAVSTGRRANISRKTSATARRKPLVTSRKKTASRVAGKKRNASDKVITKRITTYKRRPIGQYLFSGGMEYFFDGLDGRMAGYKTLAETKAAIDEEARKIDEYRKARGVKIKPPRNAPRRGRKNPSATESRAMSGRAIDTLERLGFKGVVATDMGHPHVMIKKSPDNLDLLKRYKLVRDAAQDNHPHGYYYLTGVRVLKKIFALDPLRNPKRNPSAESIRKKFAGRVSGERDVFVPSSAPKGKLAKLGRLVLIETEKGTVKPVNGSAVLLADTREKLHVGSLSGADLIDGPARSFGKVIKVEYESSKPHLGYRGPIIWFHHMGEKGGTRPTLYADGKGGLVFRGGRYRLTSRGIEN